MAIFDESRVVVIVYRIKEIRKEKGLKQAQLADRLGITSIYLSRIETGNADPSPRLFRKIAEELGVTPGELYNNIPKSAEGA